MSSTVRCPDTTIDIASSLQQKHLPDRTAREGEEHDADAGVRLEAVDDGLAGLLWYFAIEADVAYRSMAKCQLDHV